MIERIKRRSLVLGIGAVTLVTACGASEPLPIMKVTKTALCACCEGWIDAARAAGFLTEIVTSDNLVALWEKYGVPVELSSCHVSEVGGYAIVGHVPPADVIRLLKEKPKARALLVPGMPQGSPGMEHPSGKTRSYDSLLLFADGETRVFAHHEGNIPA